MSFPIGEDMVVEVSYSMPGDVENSVNSIQYILETGAGWWGPIQRADLVFRLPYGLDELGVSSVASGTTGGYSSLYHQIAWSFRDIEPTQNDNITINFIRPEIRQELIRLSRAVAESPSDTESWENLANRFLGISWYYKDIRYHEYAEKALFTFRAAVAANPNNADIEAAYAWALWEMDWAAIEFGVDPAALDAVLAHVNRALALDSTNGSANDLLSTLRGVVPDFAFTPPPTLPPTLTLLPSITPTPTITLTPTLSLTRTSTRAPTLTRTPSSTQTHSPTPTSTAFLQGWLEENGESSPWLILIMVVVLLGAGAVTWLSVRGQPVKKKPTDKRK